jgi:hypothetical protein
MGLIVYAARMFLPFRKVVAFRTAVLVSVGALGILCLRGIPLAVVWFLKEKF